MLVRRENGYDAWEFRGTPSEFKRQAFAALREPVELLFGDRPAGPVQSVAIMRDEAGVPSIAIAKHKDSFSVAVLNVITPFRVGGVMGLKATEADMPGTELSTDQMTVYLSDDKSTATLGLVDNGQPSNQITIPAKELSMVIARLGEARAIMPVELSKEPPQDAGTRELVVLDPIWRTNPAPHPDLNGIILRLRHPAFGWLTFLLPHNEALSLGNWLRNYETGRATNPTERE